MSVWEQHGEPLEPFLITNVPDMSRVTKFPSKSGDDTNRHAWFGKCEFHIEQQRWTIDDFLGFGGYGQTYLATNHATGRRFIVKFLAAMDPQQATNERQLNFIENVKRTMFQHENVVTVVGVARNINDMKMGGNTNWGRALGKEICGMQGEICGTRFRTE